MGQVLHGSATTQRRSAQRQEHVAPEGDDDRLCALQPAPDTLAVASLSGRIFRSLASR